MILNGFSLVNQSHVPFKSDTQFLITQSNKRKIKTTHQLLCIKTYTFRKQFTIYPPVVNILPQINIYRKVSYILRNIINSVDSASHLQ